MAEDFSSYAYEKYRFKPHWVFSLRPGSLVLDEQNNVYVSLTTA